MKMCKEHYDTLEGAVRHVMDTRPELWTDYETVNQSDKAIRWTLLRSAKPEGKDGMTWICDNLYPYLDDTHVDTALRKITGVY